MTMLLNYNNLDGLIDEMKKEREEEDLNITDRLVDRVRTLKIMFEFGWPYQDTLEDKYGPTGIPVVLAQIVIDVCKFCADHNIDLSDAIALTYTQ